MMARSTKFGLFEGPPGRLRPTFKQSSVSSGMLHILGRMIGHSIIMDRQGFPFLSPPCYYYMCGYLDKALSLIQSDDVGDHINYVIEQVCTWVMMSGLGYISIPCVSSTEALWQGMCDWLILTWMHDDQRR